jgi:hypothetical protein
MTAPDGDVSLQNIGVGGRHAQMSLYLKDCHARLMPSETANVQQRSHSEES